MKTKTSPPARRNLPFAPLASVCGRFFLIGVCASTIAPVQTQGQQQASSPPHPQPGYAAARPQVGETTLAPNTTGETRTAFGTSAPGDPWAEQQPSGEPTDVARTLELPALTQHEVSVSGDFMLGEGTVTLPLGYSLRETLGSLADVPPLVAEADRSSVYFGTTISYSYGQAWYVDLSFARGESSGRQNLDVGWLGSIPSEFEIADDWFQAYVRYTFPRLRGKRLSAYLRAGASVVLAELKADAVSPAAGRYAQTDETRDVLGNAGFGLGYSIYSSRRWRLLAQLEGEGFFGYRAQESLESLGADEGLAFKRANIDNTLYGGIGRGTLRYELRLGRSGLLKLYADGGAQVRYTVISYPDATAPDELLWGPYVKLGFRYAF